MWSCPCTLALLTRDGPLMGSPMKSTATLRDQGKIMVQAQTKRDGEREKRERGREEKGEGG